MQSFPSTVDTAGSSDCNHSNGIACFHQQVTDLTNRLSCLENVNRQKDAHLKDLQCDNERLSVELKRQQRCNRNLKQQLDDERLLYQKEKDHFYEEMQNHRVKCAGSISNLHLQQQRELEKMRETLEVENKQLREKLFEKSETTYSLCVKYLRMKDARDTFREKLDRILREHLYVMSEMMGKLDEAREELNIIVSDKFQDPLPLSKAKFLQVVQRNSRLVYENATLKLHIQQLTHNVEKFKSESQKPKVMNVDTRTIAKLNTCGLKRRTEATAKTLWPSLCREEDEESSAAYGKTSKTSSVISPLNTRAKGTHSTPGIIEKVKFQQARFSENCTE